MKNRNQFLPTLLLLTGLLWLSPAMAASEEESLLDEAASTIGTGVEVVTEKSSEAWEATKDGTSAAVEYTTETASKGWVATKHAGSVVVVYSQEKYQQVNESLSAENDQSAMVEDKSIKASSD